jgi:hypothetical protein
LVDPFSRSQIEEETAMRPQSFLLAVVVMLAALATARLAMAQTYSQGHADNPNGSTVSPYLNLLQGNNQFSTVPTYQSLVKPMLDQQSAIQQQGNSLNRLQNQVNSQAISGPGARSGTGHTTRFMNYSHFYTSRLK